MLRSIFGLRVTVEEFIEAATSGELELIKQYISENINNPTVLTNIENTRNALYGAAGNNHAHIIKILLEIPGIDVRAVLAAASSETFYRASPFYHAVYRWKIDSINTFLSHPKFDIEIVGRALAWSASSGNVTVIQALIKKDGIPVNSINNVCIGSNHVNTTALMAATRMGRHKVVEALLTVNEIDVNIADADGRTALIYAAICGVTTEFHLNNRCSSSDAVRWNKENAAIVTTLLSVSGIDVMPQIVVE